MDNSSRAIRLDREKLQRLRRKKAWSQAALAEKAGLNLRTIKNAERGEPILIETAKRITDALGGMMDGLQSRSQLKRVPRKQTQAIVEGVSDPQVQFETGYRLANPPDGMEPDSRNALKWFTAAANQHHPEATFRIGELYYYNYDHFNLTALEGYKQSREWYRRAAELNWPEAQFQVGRDCQWEYTEQGFHEAMKWYRQAALQGHSEAQFELGMRHLENRAPRANQREGLSFLMASAQAGFAPAEAEFGWLCVKGHLVPLEPQKGIEFLKSAVKKGNTNAKFWLSKLYRAGRYVKKDIDYGYELLRSAARGRHRDSALFLAREASQKRPPDWTEVYRWTVFTGAHDSERLDSESEPDRECPASTISLD